MLVHNYRKLIIFILVLTILTALITILFGRMGKIKKNPIVAYRDRAGYIFIIQAIITFSSINQGAQNFIDLKKIYLKDKESKLYNSSMYFLACVFYTYPINLTLQICALLVFYFASDLNTGSVSKFFWFLCFYIIGGFIGGSIIGILIGTLVDHKKHIGAIIPLVVLPLFIVQGFFQ